MKHNYREHNQEADHWVDIGAQGKRKLKSTEKIVQRHGIRYEAFGMESFKDDGKSAVETLSKEWTEKFG